ncbi:hypothetical protein HDU99_005033 [Rhizoclosmatium hyalinum]|nr:hypothetical protein HDU99_005033 [Rhizoclosmatium hyalinum]
MLDANGDPVATSSSSADSLEQPLVDINTLLANLDLALAENQQQPADSASSDSDFDYDSSSASDFSRQIYSSSLNSAEARLENHLTECKNLVALLHAVSEHQARKDGFVHRGVTCNHCGAQPIRGIRYHCLNCADYDLCDSCENLGDVHVKTHAFIKIRVPLAPHANMRGAGAPVMYPGKELTGSWSRDTEVEKVLKESHFEAVEIIALFEQFLSLATVPASETSAGGITRETFDQCLGALGKEKNLITDRIFAFFDQDSDGLISFREFVLGLGVMIKGSLDERIEYAFKGYDLNSDGKISREELHRMFKAYFYLSMQLVRDYVKTVEQEMMDTFDDEASKPVSASFTAPIPTSSIANTSGQPEDNSHTKLRGYEGTMGESSRPNTAPSSSANVASVFTHVGSNSSSAVSALANGPSQLEQVVEMAQSAASSSQAFAPPTILSNHENSSSSSINNSGGLTIDVKTTKGKLPTATSNFDANGRLPSPTSANSITVFPQRRSVSPSGSFISNRSPSPVYNTPSATQFPNTGRLSGTVTTTTTTTTVVGGLLTRGTRALQEVQALRRRSNVSLRSVYRDGSTSATAGAMDLVSPVSPIEELFFGSMQTVAAGTMGTLDEQRLPVIEAMSQDAIEEMVERTFVAAGAANSAYITLEEFRKAVELDHSYLQWFEALGSVF